MIGQRKTSSSSEQQPEQKLNNKVGGNNSGGIAATAKGSVGGSVLNAQGNIELTKKNNLLLSKKEKAERRKTVMIRFGNENKENRQVVRFADGGTAMESTPPPKDFKRTTDREFPFS